MKVIINTTTPSLRLTVTCKYGHSYSINMTRKKLLHCGECNTKKRENLQKLEENHAEKTLEQNKIFEEAKIRCKNEEHSMKYQEKFDTKFNEKRSPSESSTDLNDYTESYYRNNEDLYEYVKCLK